MEQTISIKNLIFQVLFRWKGIITFAVCLAILVGGSKGYEQFRALADPSLATALRKEYEDELFLYNSEITKLESSLEQMKNQYKGTSTYFEESLLMGFDPYNVYSGSVVVYVDSYYEVMPDLTYQNPDTINQILAAYQAKLGYGEMYTDIAKALDFDLSVKYMKELVSISYNQSSRTITFSLRMDTYEGVETVADVIVEHVNMNHEIITEELVDHGIIVTKSAINELIDDGLDDRQAAMIYDLSMKILNIETKEKALEDLEEPVEPSLGMIKAVRYFVLGGIIGGVLAVGTIIVVGLFRNKFEEEAFIEREYNLMVLGVRPLVSKSKNAIDKMFAKMYNHSAIATEEEFVGYVVAGIENLNREKHKIHFTGSVEKSELEQVFKQVSCKLGEDTTVGGFVLQDMESLQLLEQSEFVVLVEKRNKTNLNDLDREIKYLEKLDKKVLGVVVL